MTNPFRWWPFWFALVVLSVDVEPAFAKPKRTGVPVAAQLCDEPGDCSLYAAECCGGCAPLTLRDAVAYNTEWVEAHGAPGCSDANCPPCAANNQTQGQLVATCVARKCVVKLLDQSQLTMCHSDAQCVAEVPRCCSCDWSNAVAIAADQREAFRTLTCAPPGKTVACPQCARGGKGPAVRCAQGHCRLVRKDAVTR